jgi:tetratricopeptide (TPR) repeat protein
VPTRTPGHQIEDESRNAFEKALGTRFVTRRLTPDYGVDAEVESFDADSGEATGLRFYAQLKATQQKDFDKALSIWIDLKTEDYYKSLPLPVLMVRYHAPKEALYVRWFHGFDPYYGGRGEKGLTFRWEREDLWNSETPKHLEADLRAYLRYRSPELPLPLRAYLEVPSSGVHGLATTEILFAFQRAAERSADVLEVARGPAPAGEIAIRVAKDELVFDIRGVTSSTLHYDEAYKAGEAGMQLAIDALALGALAFDQVGHSQVASRLTAAFIEDSHLLDHPEVLWALAGSMTRARRVTESLRLVERLDAASDDRSDAAAFVFTLPALIHSASLDHAEGAELERILHLRVDRLEDRGDPRGAASAAYSLGNRYRSTKRFLPAVRSYRRAIRLDPRYRKRPYIWAELGGVLFGGGRFHDAAAAYGRAIQLGGDGQHLSALHADSLMFAGEYEAAQAAFAGHVERYPEGDAEWRLKLLLLGVITGELGIKRQTRAEAQAISLVEEAIAQDDPAEAARLLDAALQADAVSGFAWFNYGYVARQQGDNALQWLSYLSAAILQPGDVEAWVNAIALALDLGAEATIILDIVAFASRATGAELKEQIVAFVHQQPDGVDKEGLLTTFQEFLEALPPQREDPLTVRLFGDDGTEAIEIARRIEE